MSKLRRARSVASPRAGDPDERAVHDLEAAGAVLGRDRQVRHYLVSTSREAASTATLQLREAGFEASMIENPTTAGWIVVAERVEALDLETVRLSRSLFELIASRSDATAYDGWHCDLLVDEVGAADGPTVAGP